MRIRKRLWVLRTVEWVGSLGTQLWGACKRIWEASSPVQSWCLTVAAAVLEVLGSFLGAATWVHTAVVLVLLLGVVRIIELRMARRRTSGPAIVPEPLPPSPLEPRTVTPSTPTHPKPITPDQNAWITKAEALQMIRSSSLVQLRLPRETTFADNLWRLTNFVPSPTGRRCRADEISRHLLRKFESAWGVLRNGTYNSESLREWIDQEAYRENPPTR